MDDYEVKVMGGGRIKIDSPQKITIYSYSTAFGRADHYKTKKLIEESGLGFEVEVDDISL